MVLAKELDYDPATVRHPRYNHLANIPSNSEWTTVPMTLGGGGMTRVEITSNTVFNLYRSILKFLINPPAGVDPLDINWLHLNGLAAIRRLHLYSATRGTILCDLNEVGNYLNMISRHETKSDDLQSFDKLKNTDGTLDATGLCSSYLAMHGRSIASVITLLRVLLISRGNDLAQLGSRGL